MSGLSRFLIVLFTLLYFGTYQSYAGLIMEQEQYEEGSDEKSAATVYIQDNKIKSFDDSGQFSIIYYLDTGDIIQVDNVSRTYSSTKAEDYFSYFNKYALKMKAAMQQQLSELPPDQRARAEARMKQQGIEVPGTNAGPVNITIKNTGKEKKIAGYKSVKYEISRSGIVDEEVWISNDERIQAELDMKKMADYLLELKKIEDSLGGDTSFNGESDKAYEQVYSQGFPMKTIDFMSSGKPIIEETVKVSKKNIDNGEFNAPIGYRKVPLEQMLQLGAP